MSGDQVRLDSRGNLLVVGDYVCSIDEPVLWWGRVVEIGDGYDSAGSVPSAVKIDLVAGTCGWWVPGLLRKITLLDALARAAVDPAEESS